MFVNDILLEVLTTAATLEAAQESHELELTFKKKMKIILT